MQLPRLEACWTDVEALAPRHCALMRFLSRAEMARAMQIRAAHERDSFIARRGWLREELGRRLGKTPDSIVFEHSRFGKPYIANGMLEFNFSHSQGKALLVCGKHPSIGCDLEWRNADIDCDALVRSFFSEAEKAAYALLEPEEKFPAFFNGWTCKEAYVKALGCGLSMPLNGFDVELSTTRPARLLRGCEGWTVVSLEPFPGYQAAIVAPGTWQLHCASG